MKGKIYLALVLSLFLAVTASVSFAQNTGIKSTNLQFDRLITKIETKADTLKDEADRASTSGSNNSTSADQFGDYLSNLQQSIAKLRETFDARQAVREDLTDLLRNASQVNQYLVQNRVSPVAQTQWRSLKLDITTLASYGRVSWTWNSNPVTPVYPVSTPTTVIAYAATDAQMRTLLSRIDLKTGIYRSQMNTVLRTDSMTDITDQAAFDYISSFERAVSHLKQHVDSRQSTTNDATEVLTAATYLDQLMTRNRLNTQVQAQWRNLKGDLNTLATYYRQSWNWNQTMPGDNAGGSVNGGNNGGNNFGNFDRRITGTYRLNASLSEDTTAVVDRALGSASQDSRDNARGGIERRLRSPEMIAIEMNNKTVNMASSILPQVTFQADGVARAESNARGRTITTTATVDEDGLIINYQGERASDFYVTFMPTNDRKLKVTRRIYVDNNSEGVTVTSVYDKIDNVARWASITTNNGVENGDVSGIVEDSFIVTAGTRLNAELRSRVTSSPASDRFTMEVTSPGQYRRAVISGRVLAEDANSRSAGRTRMLLAFETISLQNGRTYRFAGNVDAVASATGESIQVSNQTPVVRSQTQQKAGVGSILGALLGAITGAQVDQSGTAATTNGAVIVQQGDNLNLDIGSQFMITATTMR